MVETKAPGDASELELHIREVNTGLFVFDGAALLMALDHVSSDNAQGEQYLPDVLPILRSHERTVLAHELSDPDEMLGVNDRVALAAVRAIAQRRIHERHMLAGVTIVEPQATVIDADVEIGRDSVIAPFTSVHGSTRVGAGSTIGPHATVIDTRVGDEARILHSYLNGADVGDRVSVGCSHICGRAPCSEKARRRHVRRDQELGHRCRLEGSASVLHRRHRCRRGDEPRREHDHGQLRRLPQAPHDDRLAREDGRRHDPDRPVDGRR